MAMIAAETSFDREPQLRRFAGRLRQAMRATGHTQATLAAACELSTAAVAMYASGTRLPIALPLVRMSRELGVTCDWLLGFDGPAVVRAQTHEEQANAVRPRQPGQ